MESNHLPSGYEPPALTDELQPRYQGSIAYLRGIGYTIEQKNMKNRQLHRLIYRVRHHYLTINNAVVALAVIVAIGWVWGSLGVMQRNYTLQRTLRLREQELALTELQVRSLELEGLYYQTEEYQELAVRNRLGLAKPGEKMVILPKRDETPTAATAVAATATPDDQPSNTAQWLLFFLGSS